MVNLSLLGLLGRIRQKLTLTCHLSLGTSRSNDHLGCGDGRFWRMGIFLINMNTSFFLQECNNEQTVKPT